MQTILNAHFYNSFQNSQWIICVCIGNNRIDPMKNYTYTQKPKLNIYEREILCAPKCMLQKGIRKKITNYFFFFLLLNARIKYRIMILLCANGSVNGMNKHNDELKLTSLFFYLQGNYWWVSGKNEMFSTRELCSERMLLLFCINFFYNENKLRKHWQTWSWFV